MDPALWLLTRLRLKAFFRRWGKSLRSAKGIGLTLIGLLVFVPWMISIVYNPHGAPMGDLGVIRRFGPLVLLAYAILSLMFSTGERSLYFTPAEIAFLFPGPFTRRSLLAFKVVGIVWGCLFSSLFMMLAFGRANRNYLASYVAIALTFLFFQFMTIAVSLASNTVAALANNVRRRAMLVVVVVLVAASIFSAGLGIVDLPPTEALARVEASPVVRAVVLPLRPFVLAFASERVWPDLIAWGGVCLALDLAMLAIVFAIDAQYLETAAASSAKIYDRVQKMRRSGGVALSGATPRTTRVRLTMLPWLGGVGPILWRQLSTAFREPVRLLLACSIVVIPGAVMLYAHRDDPNQARSSLYFAQGMTLWASIFLSPLIAFDFRGDVDRMEELKTLPTHPAALVIGQVLTPVLIFTIPQWLVFGLAAVWLGGVGIEYWGALAMAMPATFLMFGIENLLFLLFPTRATAANPADFAAFGRQILLIFAKLLCVALTLGASALVGVGVFYLLGTSRAVALIASLAFASGFAAMLVPLLVFAFERYDVARDTPA